MPNGMKNIQKTGATATMPETPHRLSTDRNKIIKFIR